jgi:hypothetical protein
MPVASSEHKLRELILYIAAKSESDPNFGATKLNKLLFYSDFLAYRALGRSITGQRYQKLEFGPAPKGILPVLREMEQERACAQAERTHHGLRQRRVVALREADLAAFSAQEIDLVRDVITELWNLTGSEVSDLSHQFVGWQVAGLGEEIPYGTVWIAPPRPLTPEEEQWAQEAIAEFRCG